MSNTYVTFGRDHTHRVNGVTIDKDCVAVIKCSNTKEGRDLAFKLFNTKFFCEYHEDEFNMNNLKFFPRGLINVN